MDDSAQQRLFAETPGSIEPPEPGLYLGTSGWSYADWEGTLYPEALPSASRLAEYVKRYATVEIDSTFYGIPRRSTVQKWREVSPDGFLFAAKFPKDITHQQNLVGAEAEVETFYTPWPNLETGSDRSSYSSRRPSTSKAWASSKTSSNVCPRASVTPSRSATGAGSART